MRNKFFRLRARRSARGVFSKRVRRKYMRRYRKMLRR